MNSALSELNAGLAKSFSGGARHPETWGDATRMEKARIQADADIKVAEINAQNDFKFQQQEAEMAEIERLLSIDSQSSDTDNQTPA